MHLAKLPQFGKTKQTKKTLFKAEIKNINCRTKLLILLFFYCSYINANKQNTKTCKEKYY